MVVIFVIENTNAPTGMETHQFRGISTASKSLDEFGKQAKPTFELNDDKWTYATKMIEYKALTELYANDTQIRIKDEHGEPALVKKTTPPTANNYCRVLAHDERTDDIEKPADEAKYDDSFGVDFRGYYETMTERKANNLAAAARNKNDTAFAQTRANDKTTNEEKVAYA